jgi:hypothetical protein
MTPTATANLGSRRDKIVLGGLLALAERVAVIGIQEGGDRGKMIEEFCAITGWLVFWGDIPGSASVPILWDPEQVHVTHPGTRPATDATDCGSCGSGPDVVKAKVWNHVRVSPCNGDQDFVFINGHMPASLYCKCRNRLGNEMIEELVDMVENRVDKVSVVIVMDANSRSWAKRWRPLRAVGVRQWTSFPTHRLRSIDLTWTLQRRARAKRFKGKYSDHRWVILYVY